MRLAGARITVAAFLFVTPTAAAADVESFTLGRIDLLDLAASVPPGTPPAPGPQSPRPPRTLRDLHLRVESLLDDDVKAALLSARWRLERARQNAAIDTRTGSYEGNPWGALLAVVVGSVSYGMDTGLRRAKECVAFLEGLGNRTRALLEDVPETDASAPPELLARWERLRADLLSNGICPGRRAP